MKHVLVKISSGVQLNIGRKIVVLLTCNIQYNTVYHMKYLEQKVKDMMNEGAKLKHILMKIHTNHFSYHCANVPYL